MPTYEQQYMTVMQSSQWQNGITTYSSINTSHKYSMLFNSETDKIKKYFYMTGSMQMSSGVIVRCLSILTTAVTNGDNTNVAHTSTFCTVYLLFLDK